MLTIRLSRVGRKNLPSFRLIVQEKARPVKSGQYLEVIGHYDPREPTNKLEFKKDRLEHYLKNGAMPSDTAARLLAKAGVSGLEKFTKKYTKQKSRKKEEKAEAVAPAAGATKAEPAEGDKAEDKAEKEESKPAEETKKEEAKPAEDKEEEQPKSDEKAASTESTDEPEAKK